MSPESPSPVTTVLKAAAEGDRDAASQLLPLVYGELRKLARARMARLIPGQTLQPTALVHEVYLRVVGKADPGWDGRGHFFAAAAQSMRDILVDQARRKGAIKRGGDRARVTLEEFDLAIQPPSEDVLALDEALKRLRDTDVWAMRKSTKLSGERSTPQIFANIVAASRPLSTNQQWLSRRDTG